jgi:hypothetical protein
MFDEAKFWSSVYRPGDDACWPWLLSRDKDGYGRFYDTAGKAFRAHRVAWALATGHHPYGLIVRHTCDNPPCCNTKHLIAGTTQENVDDKMEKGRGNVGAVNGLAKLSEYDVLMCRARYVPRHPNHGCTALAKEFGVSPSTMSLAITGKQWAYLNQAKEG